MRHSLWLSTSFTHQDSSAVDHSCTPHFRKPFPAFPSQAGNWKWKILLFKTFLLLLTDRQSLSLHYKSVPAHQNVLPRPFVSVWYQTHRFGNGHWNGGVYTAQVKQNKVGMIFFILNLPSSLLAPDWETRLG